MRLGPGEMYPKLSHVAGKFHKRKQTPRYKATVKPRMYTWPPGKDHALMPLKCLDLNLSFFNFVKFFFIGILILSIDGVDNFFRLFF